MHGIVLNLLTRDLTNTSFDVKNDHDSPALRLSYRPGSRRCHCQYRETTFILLGTNLSISPSEYYIVRLRHDSSARWYHSVQGRTGLIKSRFKIRPAYAHHV